MIYNSFFFYSFLEYFVYTIIICYKMAKRNTLQILMTNIYLAMLPWLPYLSDKLPCLWFTQPASQEEAARLRTEQMCFQAQSDLYR